MKVTTSVLFEDYGGGKEMPLGGYGAIIAVFNALLAAFLASRKAPGAKGSEKLSLSDFLLLGASTHKLTRIITKDWVTAPLRAPFTRYEKSAGSGELEEKSRGEGFKRAIGDLMTCNYCSGPWVALGLYAMLLMRPSAARKIMTLFSAVTVSDFLHMGYETTRAAKNLVLDREESKGQPGELDKQGGKYMPKLKEVMSTDVEVVNPNASLKEVAEKMKKVNSGAIPVCDNNRLTGMVTDRDIVLRALAVGRDPAIVRACDVMTSPIVYCFEDQDISEATHVMEQKQIRRLVVLDRDKKLAGIVSLGDIAVKNKSEQMSGEILKKVSEPMRGAAA